MKKITGSAERSGMYKVRWVDCYGETHSDYVIVPNDSGKEAAETVVRAANMDNFVNLTETTERVEMHEFYIVLP